MDLQILRDLLVRWAKWVIVGHQGTMGYALPKYAEMVGKGAYGEWGIDTDPEVLELDESYRQLPDTLRAIIYLHYIVPGLTKTKYDKGQAREYFFRKKLAEETLLSVHTRRVQQKQVATAV